MANIHQFDQNVRTTFGAYELDINTPIETALYVDMKNYDLVVGVGLGTNIASGKNLVITMYQATSTAGAASVAVCSETVLSTASAHGLAVVAQVRGEDLSTTTAYHYVGWKLTSDDTTVTTEGSGCLHQMRARYKQATMPA